MRPRLIGVEVMSDELLSQGVEIAARTTATAARKVLAAASTPVNPS